MRNYFEYIADVSKEKQERLMKTWTQRPTYGFRWEDLVEEANNARKEGNL